MYKTLKEITDYADQLNMTVGAFNMHNLEMLPGMIRGAQELGLPIVIQTSVATAQYIGYDVIVAVCKQLANNDLVDVALHLDHARDFDAIRDAIEAGYSSVMFDGSNLPFKENIAKTKAVVDYAHARGVSVEGELGTIGGTEEGISVSDDDKEYTRPNDAVRFLAETGVGALAVGMELITVNLNLKPMSKSLCLRRFIILLTFPWLSTVGQELRKKIIQN